MRFEVMTAPDLDIRPQFQPEDFIQEGFQTADPSILAAEQGAHDRVPLSSSEQDTIAGMESQFAPETSRGPVPQIEFTGKKKSLDELRGDIGAILVGVNTVIKNKDLAEDIVAFDAATVRLREAAQLQAIEDMNQLHHRLAAAKKKSKSEKDETSDYDLAA